MVLLRDLNDADVALDLRLDDARALLPALRRRLIQFLERLVELGGEVVLLHRLGLERLGGRLGLGVGVGRPGDREEHEREAERDQARRKAIAEGESIMHAEVSLGSLV